MFRNIRVALHTVKQGCGNTLLCVAGVHIHVWICKQPYGAIRKLMILTTPFKQAYCPSTISKASPFVFRPLKLLPQNSPLALASYIAVPNIHQRSSTKQHQKLSPTTNPEFKSKMVAIWDHSVLGTRGSGAPLMHQVSAILPFQTLRKQAKCSCARGLLSL